MIYRASIIRGYGGEPMPETVQDYPNWDTAWNYLQRIAPLYIANVDAHWWTATDERNAPREVRHTIDMGSRTRFGQILEIKEEWE